MYKTAGRKSNMFIYKLSHGDSKYNKEPQKYTKDTALIKLESDIAALKKRFEKNPWNKTIETNLRQAIEKRQLLLNPKFKNKVKVKAVSTKVKAAKKITAKNKVADDVKRTKPFKVTQGKASTNTDTNMYEALKKIGLV